MTPRKEVPPDLQIAILETLTTLGNASTPQILAALKLDYNRSVFHRILLQMQDTGAITRSNNFRARNTWRVTVPRSTITRIHTFNPLRTAMQEIAAYLSTPGIHPADKIQTALIMASKALDACPDTVSHEIQT